jgi:AraC-like DNA-binding protein
VAAGQFFVPLVIPSTPVKNETIIPAFYYYKRIVQAKLFIDAHFGEQIDLDHIAGEAHFSKFHFIRLFKKAYGKTPHQYLIKVRINAATAELERGSSVAESCFAVGFDSVSTFTGTFRKIAGITPSAYQLRYIKRQKEIKTKPLHFIPNCFAENKGWKEKAVSDGDELRH